MAARLAYYCYRQLMKERFLKKQDLQDTLFLQKFVIIHVIGYDWLCVSNKFWPPGTVMYMTAHLALGHLGGVM